MCENPYTKEQYAEIDRQIIEIERNMDSLKSEGVGEDDLRMKELYSRWEDLQFLVNS